MADRSGTRRGDLLLIGGLLLLAGALALLLFLTRTRGALARVTVDGQIVAELPLDEDTELLIGEGAHTNLLVIRDGAARVTQATCPDGLCVNQGAVRYTGQSIVCLPHGVVVTVENGPGGFDAETR